MHLEVCIAADNQRNHQNVCLYESVFTGNPISAFVCPIKKLLWSNQALGKECQEFGTALSFWRPFRSTLVKIAALKIKAYCNDCSVAYWGLTIMGLPELLHSLLKSFLVPTFPRCRVVSNVHEELMAVQVT